MTTSPTVDNPESVRCPSCGVLAGTPCTDLDTTVTVNGVTRRAVHADRYAAGLPPAERGGYWRGLIERYYAEQDESTNPERKAAR